MIGRSYIPSALQALARVRRSSGWFALISDAIVEYPEPWKQSISVSMPDLRPSRHQILLYPTKKGDVGDGHEDSRSAVD
jgi:hypothetical protein